MGQIIIADVLDGLRQIESGMCDTCITSPPYYGLRDYGTATWEGGDPECDHVIAEIRTGLSLAESTASVRGGANKLKEIPKLQAKAICPKCGAARADKQIGIEETPVQYINRLVEAFREVRRVLKPDGTLWLNIGDSYAGSGKGGQPDMYTENWQPEYSHIGASARRNAVTKYAGDPRVYEGMKNKDLMGIPWMLAFALRADGWWLRQDIIWHKPNAMPESVKDRCTKSHEYIFLLSKSQAYYFDSDAIKEKAVSKPGKGATGRGTQAYAIASGKGKNPQQDHSGWCGGNGETRNKRDVWTVATRPYKGAHFAVFPPELIRPCVLAGSRKGGIVLDPFIGSGTTAAVAVEEGRDFIGIDIHPNYAELARKRVGGLT